MANEACSYGANCMCVGFPMKIGLIKCKYCDNELHHVCQTSYLSKVNYDDGLQHACIECVNKTVDDAALKEFDNMLNTENTEQGDQTETTATQLTTTQNSLVEGFEDVLNNNHTEETEGTEMTYAQLTTTHNSLQQDDDELDQKQENTFDTFKYGTPQP